MEEQERWELASIVSEAMYNLWEAECQEGALDLDSKMRRLKDLSAYSLTHADIMVRRQGVELLALGKLFGMTSDPRFRQNQERLSMLSEETLAYQGQAETIVQEIKEAEARKSDKAEREGLQPRLF